jgi:hypothetical protein
LISKNNVLNQIAIIKFALPKRSRVTLIVYETTGRAIDILIKNEELRAGIFENKFEVSMFASVIYF